MTLLLLSDGEGTRIVRRMPEGQARRDDALLDLLFA